MQEIKKQLIVENKGLIEIKKVKTLRNTSFGRAITEKQINEAKIHFMYLVSDQEIKILKANPYKECEHHLLVDTTIKLGDPAGWKF